MYLRRVGEGFELTSSNFFLFLPSTIEPLVAALLLFFVFSISEEKYVETKKHEANCYNKWYYNNPLHIHSFI